MSICILPHHKKVGPEPALTTLLSGLLILCAHIHEGEEDWAPHEQIFIPMSLFSRHMIQSNISSLCLRSKEFMYV